MKGKNKDDRQADDGLKTTIRAKVTPEEHNAVKRIARSRLGTTIEEFVRCAVDSHLRSVTGKTLAELVLEGADRDRYVQGDLFEQGGL